MVGTPAGVRRLCVVYDVEGYSTRDVLTQLEVQRRLTEILVHACREAGLAEGSYDFQKEGDGGLAVLPTGTGVDEPRLLADLLRVLETDLVEANTLLSAEARIRLRLALCQGVVLPGEHGYIGPAVIDAFRMCDTAVSRAALAANPGAFLVVLASDELYRDVLRHGMHGLPGRAFVPRRLVAKNFAADGWVHVPGGTVPAETAINGATTDAGPSGRAGLSLVAAAVDALVQAGFANDPRMRSLLVQTVGGELTQPFIVPDQASGRDHLIEIVSACMRTEKGLLALAQAMELMRPGSPGYHTIRRLTEE